MEWMCGIAGFVTLSPVSDPGVLERMTRRIEHRGPDDSGFFSDGIAHLGHRRLSIVDLAAGHQPMSNETRSRWIVYNGEVFNHADLRPDLERAGHAYATRSDTETLIHAWEEYGANFVTRLRGMFAFGLWDQPSRKLFCARDRLGIKPFYYFWNGRLFAFASEIKALLEHPQISAELETGLLPEYLAFGYTSGEGTLFRNIRKLMPGHHLTLEMSGTTPRLTIQRYWDVPPAAAERRDEKDWIAETRLRLEEAVRTRLMSDVPLGIFLSGGVDSSAIAALMMRATKTKVKTFSVGYPESSFSELSYAAEVARTLGTDHHEVVVGMEDFFSVLPKLVWHEDEPISWPSSVSLFFVSRLAARDVKVVLTGEGSDEIFAGYERYRWNLFNLRGARAWRYVPGPLRRLIRKQLSTTNLLRADLRRKLRHTFVARESTIESMFLENFYSAFSAEEQHQLLASPSGAAYDNYLRYWNSRSSDGLLPRMLYADQKTYLVELLMKQDQMSMAASIESRVPFLDHHLVEFAARIPDALKIRGGEQKYVLKKAVEDLLPASIVYRKKMGFPTPLRQWLREPRAAPLLAALQDRRGFLGSYLDLGVVDALVERHKAGLEDATDRLWRLINLQIWGDLFLAGAGVGAAGRGLETAAPSVP
jgi:asparagine synthase (glutamine-hydrolysing)